MDYMSATQIRRAIVAIMVVLSLSSTTIMATTTFDSPVPCPYNWVAFGDSITQGASASPGHSFVDLMSQSVGMIDNRGMAGTKTYEQLGHISNYTGTAQNVLWLVGFSDMREATSPDVFEAHLRSALSVLVSRRVIVFLGTTLRMPAAGYGMYPPADKGSDAAVNNINIAIRRIAIDYPDVFVVDTSNAYDPANASSDLCHPNDVGHAQIAQAFLNVISHRIFIPIVIR
jgi:lysophospholipase L1-like esterase